jgi:hypothetical protein
VYCGHHAHAVAPCNNFVRNSRTTCKLSASFTCVSRACGRSALGGRPGVTAAASAAAGEVAPRIERDDPLFENWMYLEGPCGVWSDAQRDGTDEGLTKEIVRAAGCVHPPKSSFPPPVDRTHRPKATNVRSHPQLVYYDDHSKRQPPSTLLHSPLTHSPSSPPNRPQYKKDVWSRLPLNTHHSLTTHHNSKITTHHHRHLSQVCVGRGAHCNMWDHPPETIHHHSRNSLSHHSPSSPPIGRSTRTQHVVAS